MARKATVTGNGNSSFENVAGNDIGDAGGNFSETIIPGQPIIIDPVTIGGNGNPGDSGGIGGTGGNNQPGSSDPPKRRGRKPGSTNAKKTSSVHLDVDAISTILFSTHQMLAVYSKIPELEIDEAESEKLAKGIANVSRHYDTQVSAKALDWYYLIQVLVLIYGTRLYAIRERRREEKKPVDVRENTDTLRTIMTGSIAI